MPLLLVAASAHGQLEPAVEGGEQLFAFAAAYGRAGRDQGRRERWIRAAGVQHVPDRAVDDRDGHLDAVGSTHLVHSDMRHGLRLRLGLGLRVGVALACRVGVADGALDVPGLLLAAGAAAGVAVHAVARQATAPDHEHQSHA